MRPAVFLDRDGTISEEVGYISDPKQLRLIPGAAEAIGRLNRRGLPAILVTNQSGAARGLYGEETIQAVLGAFQDMLAAAGAHLDAVYYCPHLPGGSVPGYARVCRCRKPEPGLLQRAAMEHGLDLERSFMIGDKLTDLLAGWRAGCRSILVLTGHGAREWAEIRSWPRKPDWVAEDLAGAVEIVLSSP